MSSNHSADRPDQPLIVKCWFDNSMRRITFVSATTCKLDAIRARVEDCFSLGASSFFIAYTDDDGEETSIRSEVDLTEAIHYFISGEDEYSAPASSASTYSSDVAIPSRSKITLRVQVVVEYDGPSLSDTASIAESFEVEGHGHAAGGSGGWQSGSSASGSEMSYDTGPSRRIRDSRDLETGIIFEEDEDESVSTLDGVRAPRTPGQGSDNNHGNRSPQDETSSFTDSTSLASSPPEPDNLRRRSSSNHSEVPPPSSGSHRTSLGVRPDHTKRTPRPSSQQSSVPTKMFSNMNLSNSSLTSRGRPGSVVPRLPESSGPPSILTNSELGVRWLREQNERVLKKMGDGGTRAKSDRSWGKGGSDGGGGSDDDDEASIYEEGRADLALVMDRRGKWYYSYQTTDLETSEDGAQGDRNHLSDSRANGTPNATRNGKQPDYGYMSSGSSSSRSPSPNGTESALALEDDFVDEPAGPPYLAPDCSACGLRLDYMRYVCGICGEGHMWQEGEKDKGVFYLDDSTGVTSSDGDGVSSGQSEWGQAQIVRRASSGGSETIYDPLRYGTGGDIPADSESLEPLIADPKSLRVDTGVSGTSPSPSSPPRTPTDDSRGSPSFSKAPTRVGGKPLSKAPHGYELCAGCIEIQGIAHAKAMGSASFGGESPDVSVSSSSRRLGGLRHTYRELIWGSKGWQDIEYNDECRCSICNLELYQNRYKCVSCSNFNLCRSCHQNAQEIHPAHCFLAVPDQHKRIAAANGKIKAAQNSLMSKREPISLACLIAADKVPIVVKHPGAFCHNCLQDIVGPRFHCAVCPSWDLCIQCEGVSSSASGGPGGAHSADHIMMKIPLPLASSEVEYVSRRARERWAEEDSSTISTGTTSPPHQRSGAAVYPRSPSPSNETVYGGGNTRPFNNSGVMVRDSLDHGTQCRGCSEWIMGRRYQCANCPSDPVPYSLCSICELRSYKIHNPMHVFIKFDRPVHYPLQSPLPVLPPLYKLPVGQVRSSTPLDPRDPTAYLKCVNHTSTICDIHVGPIQGVWLRCAQCAVSFDICQDCEVAADHDPTHVFVVFKAEVDMPTFRALAALSDTHSRPLIHQHVYI